MPLIPSFVAASSSFAPPDLSQNLLRQSLFFNYDHYKDEGTGPFVNEHHILLLHISKFRPRSFNAARLPDEKHSSYPDQGKTLHDLFTPTFLDLRATSLTDLIIVLDTDSFISPQSHWIQASHV